MCNEVIWDYIHVFNKRAIHIQVGRDPKVSCCFFCDAASAGFVEMSNLFWSSLLECHIFTTGVIMQHSISLKASLG